MRKLLIIAFISILNINGFAQIKYEIGYIIDNNGKRIDCLIKNIDWKNNPTEFKYKLSDNAKPETAKIDNITEFGISNTVIYKRFTVDIDRSSSSFINYMSTSKEPKFNKEQLFLKVLVEGKATLYSYQNKNLIRFFFSVDSLNPQQLIFKNYLASENLIAENNSYRQQLADNLQCSNLSVADIQKVNYNNHDLIKFFTAYNNCNHSGFINFQQKQKRDLFNLTFRPGLSMSNLTVQNSQLTYGTVDFGSKMSLRLGAEAEFIMPFNKYKWAIIMEPTFQSFKSDITVKNNKPGIVDYKYIDLPIGLRCSFFLNDKSKIFINGLFIKSFTITSKLDIGDQKNLDIKSRPNAAFGAGYKYGSRYSIEMRYGLDKEILSDYIYYDSHFRNFSVVIGYTIF